MNPIVRLSRKTVEAPSEPPDPSQPRLIGREIRALRKARAVTLAELAVASGLSIGYLSLLERDRATPSIKALHAVSRALGVTISWFFEANEVSEEERDLVVRRARRRRLDYSAGVVDELLSPNLSARIGASVMPVPSRRLVGRRALHAIRARRAASCSAAVSSSGSTAGR